MDRRSFHRGAALTLAVPWASGLTTGAPPASAHGGGKAAPASGEGCRRELAEYRLPGAEQTHEILRLPGKPYALVTQQGPSRLVKLEIDPRTGKVLDHRGFTHLAPENAMLHGLAASRKHPGLVWATTESPEQSALLLIDPGMNGLDEKPAVKQHVGLPDGMGPHYVGEFGDEVWATLKGSNQVLRYPLNSPHYRFYDAKAQPIFVARHPGSGDFYVSQDSSSALLHIDPRTHRTRQIPVPPERGTLPVGLVPGPGPGGGALWVVLLGSKETGTGTFGRVGADGDIAWFRLRSPEVREAGLLHVAFDPPESKRGPGLWLLGSSIISSRVLDVIVRVDFDQDYTRPGREEVAVLPTQLCKAHRLLPLPDGVLATELTSSTVATLTVAPHCHWDPPTTPAPGEPA
ncbi:hypothetical protein [Streptomyces sp. HNM0574]|uniref:hypothetical protein n=1 Tax=Streptomyces sp. HNM0574 TaxID=2714954 RepID=UPI00146B1581|nr:hypothetical protein [Streptomyces sp. HNM0574]NLU67341.1 hypothetical protein [Streptomyces sp. HNM0574]